MRGRSGLHPLTRIGAALLLTSMPRLAAEIIDRVAVSVGNQVITEDQINEELRVTAFLNHDKVDTSPAEKKKAAERLVEQALIKRDIDLSHYALPQTSDAEQSLRSIASQYPSEAEFQKALQAYGITAEDLRRHLWWQLTVLSFIDYRFRPGIQLPESDLRNFYEQEAAKWREQGLKEVPSFEDARGKIEQVLTQQRIDQAVDRWIGDTRTQVEIRYRPGAFE